MSLFSPGRSLGNKPQSVLREIVTDIPHYNTHCVVNMGQRTLGKDADFLEGGKGII